MFLVLSAFFNKKIQLIVFKTIAYTCFFVEYTLLNSQIAAIMCAVSIFRDIIFFIFERKNKKTPILILVIILVLIIALGKFLSYPFMGIFPIVCTFVYTIASFRKNSSMSRFLLLVSSSLWIGFNLYIKAYSLVLLNGFEVLSSLIAIYNYTLSENTKKRKFISKGKNKSYNKKVGNKIKKC